MRKNHLQHTVHNGPTCQRGRSGGSLRGEHFTYKYAAFVATPAEQRCARCASSKLFAFLGRKAVEQLGDIEARVELTETMVNEFGANKHDMDRLTYDQLFAAYAAEMARKLKEMKYA